MEQDQGDRLLLERISAGGPDAWETFLHACSPVMFRVVRLHTRTYDEQMDLFLFMCARLREGNMKRVRAFRFRPDAPCRFSTWLSVVARNLSVDFIRERDGRFRPFRNVEAMQTVDRLVFQYHLHDGLPLSRVTERLQRLHGIRVSESELADRAGRVRRKLSASQIWRLLSRLAQRRPPLSMDPVEGAALRGDESIPLADAWGDPERPLRHRQADDALRDAIAQLEPRERLMLALKLRDGLTAREAAPILRVTPPEAERLWSQGLARLREKLARSGFASEDFEPATLSTLWPTQERT